MTGFTRSYANAVTVTCIVEVQCAYVTMILFCVQTLVIEIILQVLAIVMLGSTSDSSALSRFLFSFLSKLRFFNLQILIEQQLADLIIDLNRLLFDLILRRVHLLELTSTLRIR